jgi:zona occludens toxin
MPLIAVTGLPGHGKTLYTLWRFKQEAEKAGRPVFHNDIPGLNIPGWQTFKVEEWDQLPSGAIFIIDEAQKVFPTRGAGRPPKFIEDLTTHRHLGLDGVLIFQNPMLVDSFVRRLVDRHFHVVRKFGTHFATIYEFTNGLQDNPKAKANAIRHEWRYSKEVFDWYKSAELHTVKRRIPARVWVLLSLPLIFGALVYFAYLRLNPEAQQKRIEEAAGVQPGQAQAAARVGAAPAAGAAAVATLTPAQYVEAYTPRIPDLPHTAPAYDHLTKPTAVPVPAICIDSARRCHCYSQQATRLQMAEDLCRRIAKDGFFQDFEPQQLKEGQQSTQAGAEQPRRLPAQIISDPKEVHAQRLASAAADAPPATIDTGFKPLPEAVARGLAGRVNQALAQGTAGAGAAPQ